MYNGIGLETARGSGTSGHVQKNLSYNVKKLNNREQFLKDLEQKRNKDLQPARKANSEIIDHQRKREILIRTMKYKKQLQKQQLSQQQMDEKVQQFEKQLKYKLEKGELQTKNKDSHVLSQKKQREFSKISQAFGISENYKPGSAFDFEAQKQQRLHKMEQRRRRKQIKCPHQKCQKVYQSKQLLDRHLKYKHPGNQSIKIKKQEQQQQQEHGI